jgi:hypothetical protein
MERDEIAARIHHAQHMMETTTVTIQRTTLERLKNLCTRAQSYDCFLNRLMDLYERQPKEKM